MVASFRRVKSAGKVFIRIGSFCSKGGLPHPTGNRNEAEKRR